MKPILFFIIPSCPYCRKAVQWLEELKTENPLYQVLDIETIDEIREAKRSREYDYYLVPTFYVGEIKRHEGIASKEIIKRLLDEALESASS